MCEKSSQIVPKLYLSLFYRTKYLMEIHMLKSVRFIHIKMGWPPNRAENDTKGQTKLSGILKTDHLIRGDCLIRCCLIQFDCTFLSVIHQQAELLLRWFPVQDCFYLNLTSVIHNLFIICWARGKRGRPKMSYRRLYSQTVLSFESNWN